MKRWVGLGVIAEDLICWRSLKSDQPCSLKIDQGRKLAASATSVV